jgi:GTP-binding protein
MKIHSVFLVSSKANYTQCPNDAKPEVAFIGRSNVGKSSLINALLQRKQLARVSKKPRKTALIHHFLVNDKIYFVDLPGYGWAQVDHATKIRWEKCYGDIYCIDRI